jgi:hypothetical protein
MRRTSNEKDEVRSQTPAVRTPAWSLFLRLTETRLMVSAWT